MHGLLSAAFILMPFMGPLIGYYTYKPTMGMSENKYIMYWSIFSTIFSVIVGLILVWEASC